MGVGGICGFFGTAQCKSCEFAFQIPESCSGKCGTCKLDRCPCRQTLRRGMRSSFEAVHGKPEERRQLREEGGRVKTRKICEGCGEPYLAGRKDQRFCSKSCRQKHSTAKKLPVKYEGPPKAEIIPPSEPSGARSSRAVFSAGMGLGVGGCVILGVIAYFLGMGVAAAFVVGIIIGVGAVKESPRLLGDE